MTTVMHEIAHGLGFNGMCYEPSDGIGAYSWTTDHPAIFDDFMINLDGQKLTDENIFANYSAELMAEFESGYLDFAGEWSKTKLNGSYPRLYAPLSYDEGSSLYHLNELSYNNENALMTPAIGKGEAIHDPGIALTMLEETGWINTTISHQELTDTEELSAPLEVTAAIVSDKGLDSTSVQLIYTDADFSTADSLSMTWLQANDLFSAEIPVTEAATFQYYLTAQNIEGRRFRLPADAPQSYFDVHVGPDQQAPVIAHDPVKIMLENNQTAAITAVVSDNIAVSDVELEYAANKEAFQTLSLNSDGDSYETNLSFSDLVDGDSIRYRLIATDSSSQSNTTSSPADGYYTISVEGYYAPLTTYSNDFNNTSRDFISTDFYIGTELGFENGSLNSPHPYPSPNANDESYNLSCTLKHPIILEENGKMNFNEVVLVEPGDDGAVYGSDNFWDYVIVEGSLDGTTNWLPLTDGYDAGQNSPWLSAYESSTVGRSDLLLPHEINLTENGNFSAGQTVYIRFRLYSDPFVNGWGWVIDDLVIQDPKTASETMLASSGTFSFYPNPVKSKLFIEANLATAPGKIRYQLQTTSGQQIQSGIFDGQSQQLTEKLDLSMLTPGFYFLVLDFENGERFSQKIIRQ
ncbi:T9SS type A sorting domain-containing protein [Mangrovibacterium marinum]|uniref:T9SS type A sorting domain-containing protein n=1 Tax=Mangrovibacterium marinum TaxID=1639118 RepID=UPI002A18C29E|nr:T9SS type A sorting domain-containing protein [Mangrovibacterium marinum]